MMEALSFLRLHWWRVVVEVVDRDMRQPSSSKTTKTWWLVSEWRKQEWKMGNIHQLFSCCARPTGTYRTYLLYSYVHTYRTAMHYLFVPFVLTVNNRRKPCRRRSVLARSFCIQWVSEWVVVAGGWIGCRRNNSRQQTPARQPRLTKIAGSLRFLAITYPHYKYYLSNLSYTRNWLVPRILLTSKVQATACRS